MDRRRFVLGCGCSVLAAPSGLLAAEQWSMPARLQRPESASDEGGLWSLLDREEARLKRSRFLVRDEALNKYVSGIACKLAGEHCPDLRVYLVRSPYFNASMAPNGMMQVWSGLLLRAANEAQLAAVIGHEIGHYLARHSVEMLRDAKSRSAFGQFLGLALAAAGVGAVGSLAQLALIAGQFAYSREHERQADQIGLELMSAAGYAPVEAARVWEQLLRELQAEKDWSGDAGNRSVLFASHPAPEDRQRELAERAAAMAAAGKRSGAEDYHGSMARHRRDWLEDELKRRRLGESVALLQRLMEAAQDDGELHFFLGEAYRLRGGEGDAAKALAALSGARDKRGSPPELYRSLGMLHRQAGDEAAAGQAFRRYLSLKPEAEDAAMIRSYIKEGG